MAHSADQRTAMQRRPVILIVSAAGIMVIASTLVIISALVIAPGRTALAPGATATVLPTVTPTATAFAPTAAPPKLHTGVAYALDPDTGTVLLDMQGEQPRAMASTTKIMTAVVAILYGKLDQTITVPQEIHQLDGTGASRMCTPCIKPVQQYTLRDLLYGLLLPSGDDAAITIADGVDGTQANFVAQMNALAQWLGLQQTHYVNPHGLDAPGHTSSAADLARLSAFALTLPEFRQIVATGTYMIPATATHPTITLTNTNTLLLKPGGLDITGVKTGHTQNAGYCLVAAAIQGSHHIIVVVLGESDTLGTAAEEQLRFTDSAALITWGLAQENVYAPQPTPVPATPVASATP